MSAVWGTLGVLLLGRAAVRRQPVDLTVLAATVVAGWPALYYTVRHLLRSAG